MYSKASADDMNDHAAASFIVLSKVANLVPAADLTDSVNLLIDLLDLTWVVSRLSAEERSKLRQFFQYAFEALT
jgi:hypothetical protein